MASLTSVIIRTKDRPKLLKRALKSVSDQSLPPDEVIIVNDGGQDLPVDEYEGFSKLPIHYISLTESKGRAGAANEGLKKARGEYIFFLDDDDRYYPTHIETLLSFLKDSDFKIAYSDAESVSLRYNPDRAAFEETSQGIYKSLDFSPDVLLFENFIPLICVGLHRSVVERIGLFDEKLPLFEDWDFFIRASRIYPFYHIRKVTCQYTTWSQQHQIAHVNWARAKEAYIQVLRRYAHYRTAEATYNYHVFKETQIRQRDHSISSLSGYVAGRDEPLSFIFRIKEEHYQKELSLLRERLQEREELLKEIESSLGWRILAFYRNRIKSRLFPGGSRREHFYRAALKGLSMFNRKGLYYTIYKGKNFLKGSLRSKRISKERYIIPEIIEGNPQSLGVTVSVVIPTKNAGSEFRRIMERIKSQKGVKEIEVIVVDSGSEDETKEIARDFNAKVVDYSHKEFNHGEVRNAGERHATGEYIFFMSQDAIPASEDLFFRILKDMKEDEMLAAATVKQIPRSDADLFSCWQLWFYTQKILRLKEDRKVFLYQPIEHLSAYEVRAFAQLDNVCSVVRKDLFDRLRFRPLPYGEDLDLGIRILKENFGIKFYSTLAVIHSHNRGLEYIFKRSFLDTYTLLGLLGERPINWDEKGVRSLEDLYMSILTFYRRVNYIRDIFSELDFYKFGIDELFRIIRNTIFDQTDSVSFNGDYELERFFKEITGISVFDMTENINTETIGNLFVENLKSFLDYIYSSGINLQDKRDEFIKGLYKLFTQSAGSLLGNMAYFLEKVDAKEVKDEYLFSLLTRGV